MKNLYLKQGTKSIFKNKMQLIIVLILAFLFSFIFTSWFTVERNFSKSFHNATDTFIKPDDVYSEKVSSAHLTLNEVSKQFIPLFDFIKKNNNENEFLTLDNGVQKTTAVNFLLNDFNDKANETFITKSFTSQGFQDAYSELMNGDFGNVATSYTWKFSKGAVYNLKDEQYTIDPSNGFRDDIIYKTFIGKTTLILVQNYLKDIENKKQYLLETLGYKYLQKEYGIFNRLKSENLDLSYDDWKSSEDKFNESGFCSYLYYTFETLPIVFLTNLKNFFIDQFDEINSKKEVNHDNKENFLTTFNEESPYLKLDMGSDGLKQTMEVGYEYIMGSSMKSQNIVEPNFLFSKDISWCGKTNFKIGESIKENKMGMYGYTNNFSFQIDNTLIGIVFDTNYYMYSRVPNSETYNSAIGGLNYDVSNITYDNKNLFSMRTFHFKLAAIQSNIKIDLREEAFAFDPIEKINYRFVVSDDFSSLKILTGKKPSNLSTAISQQFANARKIKNKIMINNIELNVSGVGTEALTYLQFADIEAPIIDNDQTCIVYLTKEAMRNIFNNKDGNGLIPQFSNNYFLYGSKKNISNFLSYTSTDNKKLNDNVGWNITQFDKSNWSITWKYVNKILLTLNIIGIISILAIGVVIIYSMLVVISKCIKQNQQQLINLKIQGVKNKSIAVSFLIFPVLIIFLSFILGYVIASVFQKQFVTWFTAYAVISKTGANFDWLPAVIIFFIVGTLLFICCYFITFFLIKKLNLKKNKTEKQIKEDKFKKLGLKMKIHLNVLSKAKFEIFVLGILSLTATFMMTIFGVVISSFDQFQKESKQIVKYNNSYLSSEPLINSPFSKKTINIWNGFTEPSPLEGEVGSYIKTFYDDIENYEATVNNATVVPKFIYTNDDVKWTNDYVLNQSSVFMSLIALGNIFINNAAASNDRAFSIGTFEQLENYLLHRTKDSSGNLYNDTDTLDPKRVLDIKNFEEQFKNWIPTLLQLMFGGSSSSIQISDDWRETLLSVARDLLPNSFAKKYVTDERKTQFYFAMDSENIIPGSEDLGTFIDAKQNNNVLKITGMSANQKSFNIGNVSSPFLNENIWDNFNSLNYDINSSNIKIYDANSKTLTIPVVASSLVASKINESDLNLSSRAFVLNKKVIPSKAFVYLNADENNNADLIKINSGITNADLETDWLSVNDLDTSKFNYFNAFKSDKNGKPQLQKLTQFFLDEKIENNSVVSILRPYYNYNNVLLMIPKNLVGDVKNVFIKNNLSAATAREYNIKNDVDLREVSKNLKKNWFGNIDSDVVPESIKEAWNDDGDYVWVAPYNLNYNINFSQNNQGEVKVTDVLASDMDTWIDDAINKVGSPLKEEQVNLYPNGIQHIKLKVISKINSYDSNLILADQKLVNFAKGYSTKDIVLSPIQSKGEIEKQVVNGDNLISIYENENPKTFIGKRALEKTDVVLPAYFNMKFSKFDEPLNLTAGMSGTLNNGTGIGMLFHDGINSVKSAYSKVDLVSLKLRTMENISSIALEIGLFVLIGVVIICALVIFILADIFMMKYRDMVLMLKVMGYYGWEISWIIISPQIAVFAVGLVLGVGLPFAVCPLIFKFFTSFGILINTYVAWYTIVALVLFLSLIFALGNIYTMIRIKKEK